MIAALPRALKMLGIRAEALLGEGGEARVYALDGERVARVYREGARRKGVDARSALLRELAAGEERVGFSIPHVLETLELEGQLVTIERRLAGESLRTVLDHASGARRAALIRAYLDAASEIAALGLTRPYWGELCQPKPIRETSWRGYLEASASRSLRKAGGGFGRIDAGTLARALPASAERAVVHLDAFPANMMSDGRSVTAVIDFGTVTLVGDPRLDPLTAAVYLQPPMTPSATEADRAVARTWLAERGLLTYLEAAERWTAAFWAWAEDDTTLHAWCRRTLLES